LKIFRLISVLFCYLFVISGQLCCQDLLYKRDSTIVRVNIKDFNGKTLLYQVPGDSSGRIHYISKSTLDSLKYTDGRSLGFPVVNSVLSQHLIKRNYIGVDIFNLAFSNPNIWYERMSENGRRSIVAELLVNYKPKEYEVWNGNHALSYLNFNSFVFFTRVGINFYPFNYSLVRTGNIRIFNGLSVLFGSYRKETFETYPSTYKHVFAAALMWNLGCRIYIDDHLQIKGGIETSLMPLFTYICPEIGISIGF
jgi:hypothetical protein